MKVVVYRTRRRRDLFLIVSEDDGLSRVPDALLQTFGEPEQSLSFELTPDRKLAREDPELVLRHLTDDGYHLQLPPPEFRL